MKITFNQMGAIYFSAVVAGAVLINQGKAEIGNLVLVGVFYFTVAVVAGKILWGLGRALWNASVVTKIALAIALYFAGTWGYEKLQHTPITLEASK